MKHRLDRYLLLLLAFLLTGCAKQSIDRQSLYVTCRDGQSLLVYDIDLATGTLSETQRIDLAGKPGPITLTDRGKHLYAALNGPPRILPMTRDTKTGKLAALEPTEVSAFPTYLDVDATGRFILSASYGKGVVFSMAIDAKTGELLHKPLQFTETERSAHACLIDPSNRLVYIPHTIPNTIYAFRFEDGYLRKTPALIDGGGKPNAPAGPRHYVYHPTLPVIYFVNEINSSVSAYLCDRKSGAIQRFQNLPTLPANFERPNTCADIHLTPDGRFLYASNRGHNSIAAYALDEDGRMRLIDRFDTEDWPREFAVDVTGRYLYVAGLRSHKLAAYAIDQDTGRLTRIGTYDTPKGPIWVEAVALD